MERTLNELAPDGAQCLFTQRHVNDYNLKKILRENFRSLSQILITRNEAFVIVACLWNNLP